MATGEGGMATTNNEEYAASMKKNRLHGISKDAWNRYSEKGHWYYEVVDNGYKYNMTDVAASLGLVQLKRLDEMNLKRAKIAQRYNEGFKNNSKIKCLEFDESLKSSWHLYVIKVSNRDSLMAKLKESGIGTSLHFIPVHHHPYYKSTYNYNEGNYPAANKAYNESISIPIFPDMTIEDVDHIIDFINHNV